MNIKDTMLLTDKEEADVALSIRRECHREGINEYDTQKRVATAIRKAQVDKCLSKFKEIVENLDIISWERIRIAIHEKKGFICIWLKVILSF